MNNSILKLMCRYAVNRISAMRSDAINRVSTICFVLAMMLSAFSTTAYAQPGSGDGSDANPYLIGLNSISGAPGWTALAGKVELSPDDQTITILADGYYSLLNSTNSRRLLVASGLSNVTITVDGNLCQGLNPGGAVNALEIGDGSTVGLVLNNAIITAVSDNGCALKIGDNASVGILLEDGSVNTFTSGLYRAGIEVPETSGVGINGGAAGTGELKVKGGDLGAGIGGSGGTAALPVGAINISGGVVTATGGIGAAGIGGGGAGAGATANGADGGTINIYGGKVTATGGNNAAGIGGGGTASGAPAGIIGGSGGTIYIGDGEVVAHCVLNNAAGIGGGAGGGAGQIVIEGGIVNAWCENYGGAGIGGGRDYTISGSVEIRGGVITAKGGTSAVNDIGDGYNGSGTAVTINGNTVIFAESANITGAATGSSVTKGILFAGNTGAMYGDVTLKTVTIPSGKTLTVANGQTLTVGFGQTLTISGVLQNNGTVINSGTIIGTVTGNPPAVAQQTVIDLTALVNGGVNDAGDGWQWTSNNKALLISDGADVKITQTDSNPVDVSIDVDGTVRMELAGVNINGNHPLAVYGTVELTLTGDNILTAGGVSLPAIYTKNGNLTITAASTGSLTAQGAMQAAGIGGTFGDGFGTIAIYGGTITAISGDMGGAGIGAGGQEMNPQNATGALTIGGNAHVTATGTQYFDYSYAPGIGGGENAPCTFTLEGNATVYTTGIQTGTVATTTSGILFIGNSGTVYGSVTLQNNMTLTAGESLTIPSGVTLTIPSGVTLTNNGTITPADGSTVTVAGAVSGAKIGGANANAPTLDAKTATGVILNAATLKATTGQSVEYALNTSDAAPASGWKDELNFDGLTANTTYYFFARAKAGTNFSAGAASGSLEVTTNEAAIVPVLSNGSVNHTTSNSATVGFTTSKDGTAYYLVVAQGAAEPSSADVKAGTSLGAVSGTVSGKTVALGNALAKDIYIVVEDADGNISAPLKLQIAQYNNEFFRVNGSTYRYPEEAAAVVAEGGTITQIANFTSTGSLVQLTFGVERSYTLDFDNKTFAPSTTTYMQVTKGTVTVKNGNVIHNNGPGINVSGGGKVIVESGTYKGLNYAINCTGVGSKVTIIEGTFECTNATYYPLNETSNGQIVLACGSTPEPADWKGVAGVTQVTVTKGDCPVPSVSAGTVSRTSDTEASIGFTTSKAGTAYYLVVEKDATAPTGAQVKAGNSLGAVTAGTVSDKAVTLTAGAKDIYVIVEDEVGISVPLKIAAAAYVVPNFSVSNNATARYATLATAAEAVADGGTITMLQAVTASSLDDVTLGVAGEDKTFTIDFVSRTLASDVSHAMKINGGKVTVKNGNITKDIIVDGGELTVENGTYSGTNDAIYCPDGTVTIITGTFSSVDAADDGCLVEDNSGQIVLVCGSLPNVSNWKTGAKSVTVAEGSCLSLGNIIRTSDTEASIGFTTSKDGTAYYLVVEKDATAPTGAAVKAGTSLGAVTAGEVSGKAVTLTAGEKDIYVVVETAAGVSVPLLIQAAAYVPFFVIDNGTTYLTLDAAVAAVTNGGTITMLRDVTVNTEVTLNTNRTYTIDFGGYTFLSTGSRALYFSNAGTVTLKNGNVFGSGTAISGGTGSTVNILSGHYKGTTNAVSITAGTVTITEGHFEGGAYGALATSPMMGQINIAAGSVANRNPWLGVREVIVSLAGAPLSFTDNAAYDIPASTVGTAISNINVSGGASGGTMPYTFSSSTLPAGISISEAGLISGTPTMDGAAGTATITVTDDAGATQSIVVNYGIISPDVTAPTVTSVSPANGATNVASATGAVSVTFSEAMNTGTAGTLSLVPSGVTLSNPQWTNSNRTVTYNASDFAHGTSYTFNISGFKDVSNNEMTAVTTGYSFTVIGRETTPAASINYASEQLTGLVAGADYIINGTDYTANAGGNIAILESWMGQTLSIVKKGNGTTTVNSAAQSLTVPARPVAPTGVGSVNETVAGQTDGQITGVTAAMEYKLAMDLVWTAISGTTVTGLAPGNYQVRIKATSGDFASATASVTVNAGMPQTRILTVTVPLFAVVDYGYTQPAAQAITIANTGNSTVNISTVTVSPETAFVIGGDGGTVAPNNGGITSWTIQPKAGLNVGTHTATITVTYDGGATATASVSFTVNALVNAETPNISGQPQGATYIQNATASALTVTANVTDGGTLTYKWYRNTANSNSGATAIDNATGASYTPPTSALGTTYYYVVVTNTNTGVSGTQTTTATSQTAAVTVNAPLPPAYGISIGSFANGSVSTDKTTATASETVTLTVAPDAGYELNAISVYKTGNASTTVETLHATSLQYTFTMPAFGVTVTATFRKTADQQAVEDARYLIESTNFAVAQATANSSGNVRNWLVSYINTLISSTGVSVSLSDVTVSSFGAASAGNAVNPSGTNGSFNFYVSLTKGSSSLTASSAGTVTATAYTPPATYAVTIAPTTGGTITASPASAPADATVALTLAPGAGYELNAITAYRTGVTGTPVALSGSGNTRTFTMPAFGVTVSATFKKTQAQLDQEAIDAVKAAVEGGIYRVAQATANDAASVKTWLVNTLNVLFGQSHGLQVRTVQPSILGDASITSVTPAIAGTEAQPTGTNGSFAFTVSLTKGQLTFSATVTTGVIVATPHASTPVKRIELLPSGGLTLRIINTGNVSTGDLTLTLSGANAGAFSVEVLNAVSLPVGGETDVTLTPRADLAVGTYIATLTVSADNMTSQSAAITHIVAPTGIESPQAATTVRVHGSTLYITATTSGDAYIYNLSGQLVKTVLYFAGETATTQLPRGLYIVLTGGKTQKVVVQ